MNATEKFMTALSGYGKVRGMGEGRWRGQCPAHGGSDLNLAVARGDQGVLVKCWSYDCAEADIATALGLTLQDLFDEGGATYDYGNGHKVLRHRTPAGKRIVQRGSPPTTSLYRHPQSAPIESSAIVLLAEGEKTVDALLRMGAPCVTTWPGGSSATGKVDLAPLTGKRIILVPDNDEPGEKAMQALTHRLQGVASEVSMWRVPREHDGHNLNDAADLLLDGGSLDDLQNAPAPDPVDPVFEEAVSNERLMLEVRAEARRRQRDAEDSVVGAKLQVKTLGEIVDREFTHDWLIPDLLERGDRLVLTGNEGGGKSYLLKQISITAAAGIHPFNGSPTKPLRVLVVDAENTEAQWSRTARYMTNLAGRRGSADPRQTVKVAAGTRIDLTRKADVNQLLTLIEDHRPDVLYLGPLYKLVPHEITTDDQAAPLLATLDGIRERGIALLMEAHAGLAKGPAGHRDMRPRGSSALLGWPEFGMGMLPSEDDDTLVSLVRWRGDREKRDWPRELRRGAEGEMPWMPVLSHYVPVFDHQALRAGSS